METTRPVVVKHVPEALGFRESRSFMRDFQPLLSVDRPQIVFDLSKVKRLDATGVETLLQCMSEVMKRDGDLKLAALSPEAEVILELTRTDRLFEIYDTAADAVRSFTRYVPALMRRQPFVVAASREASPGAEPTTSDNITGPDEDAVA